MVPRGRGVGDTEWHSDVTVAQQWHRGTECGTVIAPWHRVWQWHHDTAVVYGTAMALSWHSGTMAQSVALASWHCGTTTGHGTVMALSWHSGTAVALSRHSDALAQRNHGTVM